jgi:crotonobetainyl-CoA:carnitine CoA-transferase CaiB-like acyl-CoA transferase
MERGDVLVENFRPGGLDRLGFGDEELQRLNPGLVHLAISGYGTSGADAGRPGYDSVIQAVGGLMSITGFPHDAGGSPTKLGVAISDIASGMFGAVGVLASLLDRQRSAGQRVDVSLLASTLALLVNQAQNAFVTGRSPGRRGNAHPNIVPYETFATADGEIALAVGSERQWPRFCEALGVAQLATDRRFATNGDRVENREALRPLLAEQFARRPSAEWIATLEAADVPCGAINDVLSAFATPAAEALGMRVPVTHSKLGAVDQVAAPFVLSRSPAAVRTAPPLLGEDSDAVLSELGYSADEIVRLRASGVV